MNKTLSALRKKKKWSRLTTAKKLDVPESTYRDWERGRKVPSEILPALSSIFGVSIASLLGEKDDDRNENLKKSIYYIEAGLDLLKQAIR